MNPDPNATASPGDPKPLTLKVIALGGAGGQMAARLADAWPHGAIIAVDSDATALGALALGEKFQLGRKTLRGLGTGGDFEHARGLADAEAESLQALCTGADVVLLLCGLGKGVGTGVAPLLAQVAKKSGALVLAFAAMPFEFEGARRAEQAQIGLEALKAECDGVICLPNHKLVKLVAEDASLLDTFQLANGLLADGVRAIARLLFARGLMDIDFAQLRAVVADRHAGSVFATALAGGEGRAAAVMTALLASPLLEGGAALDDASAVLVSIVGGPDLSLAEVSGVMEQINTRSGTAQVVVGAAVDPAFAHRLSVTIIATRPAGDAIEPASPRFVPPAESGQPGETAGSGLTLETGFVKKPETKRPRSRLVTPAPETAASKTTGSRRRKSGPKLQQGQLAFDSISRGRFDKSEPTIHHGEDLDVPTYIRRGVALN